MIEIREAEPYSYCQFIVGKEHPSHGQARHPWLTGTAGWFYTAVTKYILGIQPTYTGLKIDPCIPAGWEKFEVERRWRDAIYKIRVSNPKGVEKGIQSITFNGQAVKDVVPVQNAGTVNDIEVIMG